MINIQKSRQTAIMTLILSLLTLLASLEGLLNKNIYTDVLSTDMFSKALVLGTFSQDIISVLSGLILALLSVVFLKHLGYKTLIVILGLTGYFLMDTDSLPLQGFIPLFTSFTWQFLSYLYTA